MNENKTNTTKADKNTSTIGSRVTTVISVTGNLFERAVKWLRKEILLVTGIAVVLALTLNITQATPVSRWIAAPSTNCLAQGAGNTMVENNGIVYVLFGGSNSFRSYDPSSGICSATALPNFPVTVSYGAKLIAMDSDTLYAIAGGNGTYNYYYHIRDAYWSIYNRSKGTNEVIPYPVPAPSIAQGYGNAVTTVSDELYVLTGSSTDFKKYSPATNNWTLLSGTPSSIGSGGAIAYPGSGSYLYALLGNNTNYFSRYTIGGNWTTLGEEIENAPANVAAGGALTAVNGTDLYAFGGGNSKAFWRFNIASGHWTDLTTTYPLPDTVYGGGAMTTIGDIIYAMPGNMDDGFWAFDTAASTPVWTELSPLPEGVYSGGSLTTDGTTYIYATTGKTFGLFYRYDPSQDLWEKMDEAPTGIGSDAVNEARGGLAYIPNGPSGRAEIYMSTGRGTISSCTSSCYESLGRYIINTDNWPTYYVAPPLPVNATYGASAAFANGGDYIYELQGGNTNNFWKYLISRNLHLLLSIGKFDNIREIMTWIPGLITTQGQGNSVVEVNGKIYQLIGNGTSNFVEYDTFSNHWRQLPSTPQTIAAGGALTKYDDNTLFASGQSYFWKYDIPSSTWFSFPIAKNGNGLPISQILGENSAYNSTLNQTNGSHIVEKNGEFYVFPGNNSTFFKYNPNRNKWSLLSNNPGYITYGGNSIVANNYLFTLAGGGGSSFYRYNLDTNVWSNMTSASAAIGVGGAMAYPGGDFIYAFGGNLTKNYFRYCMQNTGSGCTPNTWTNLTSTMSAPQTIGSGGSLTALNSTTIYGLGGNGTRNFMRFDITNSPAQGDGTWTNLSLIDPLPQPIGSGGSLTTDGTYLYATRGDNTANFYRYDPSAPAGSRWSTLQNTPVNIGYQSTSTATYGGIIYSPSLGEIYAIPGYGAGGFSSTVSPALLFRYQLPASSADPSDDNTWTYFEPTSRPPTSFGEGASLVHPSGSDYIYAFRGGATNNFWQYDVPNNTWKNIYLSKNDDDDAFSQGTGTLTQAGGNSIAEANGELFVINGNGTTTFQKFSPFTNAWTNLAVTPSYMHYGASMTKVDNNNLLAFQGNGYNSFWRYNIPGNAWILSYISYLSNGAAISQAGASQTYGNAIVKANDPYTGNPLFFIISGNSYTFQKFDPSTNTWTTLPNLPSYSSSGSALLNIGTDIYYKIQGSTAFYKYNITDNTWTTLTGSTAATYGGNNMAYPGSGDYIYILAGATTTFYRYSISGNSWSTLAVAPATSNAGSSLTFLNSNDLYALRGAGTRDFWKYDITAGTWDTLVGYQPGFAGTVQSGGSLTSDGTYVYATVGGTTNKEFWKYDPLAVGVRWAQFTDTTIGSTGNLPANMGMASTTQSKGNITLCDNCAAGGLKEIWATTGNGVTGTSTSDTAGLIFRFRIDPVTCDVSGFNPGTGTTACSGYNTWVYYPKLPAAPASVYYGGALTYPGSGPLVYAFTGNSTNFRAYNMTTNAWITLTAAPATAMGGAALASTINGLNTDVYATFGNGYTFRMYRGDTNTGAGNWTTVDPTDRSTGDTFASGASLAYDGVDNIYATAGKNTSQIYRYNISGNSWSATSSLGATLTLPSPMTIGSNTIYDALGGLTYMSAGPSGGPELYLVTGNGRSGSVFGTPTVFQGLIFRYPLTSGVNVGTWPLMAPTVAQPASAVNYGGALTSTDSDSIFAFRGGGSSDFWRYDIGDNVWSSLTAAPATIFAGGALTNNGSNTIYATRGYPGPGSENKSFYKYTVTNASTGAGTWNSPTPATAPVYIGNTNTSYSKGGLAYCAGTASAGDESVWLAPGWGRSGTITTNPQLVYRYDITSDIWPQYSAASLTSTNTTFSSGSDLVVAPDNASIYALRGTELTSTYGGTYWSSTNSNFWKYTIATDTWSALTNVFDNVSPKRVYSGGSITGASFTPDSLYAFTGNNTKDVLVYSITGNSWLAPTNAAFPYAIGVTSTTDGGEIIYSPSTLKLLGTTGTDNAAPFTIYYLDLANRAEPSIYSSIPSTQGTFNVLVTATDLNGNPVAVTQNTTITLSKKSGTGTLGGTLTGVIPSGLLSVTISGVTYDTAEADVVITASDTSASPTLVPADVSFTVYGPAPSITQVNPTTGATSGGEPVTITGSNFVPDSNVTFDGISAPDVTYINANEIRVITPAFTTASVPLAVDVAVIAPSTQSGIASNSFTYDSPSITSITPDSGGTAGGTAVTITGSNFGPSTYARQLTINNTNANLTDFPVLITLDTATPIAAGKMRADCGDLRIFSGNQSEQYNYWVTDLTCNTANTKIWVKIKTLPSGNSDLIVTYGNKLLTTHSNGDSVFQFFDDFESSTLNTSKWTASTGTPVVYEGKLLLNNSDGVMAGTTNIEPNTIWETFADPRTTGRYGNALKGSGNTTVAWYDNAANNIVGTSWLSTTLYAEAVDTNTSMGSYAVGFKPYKVIYRPNDLNQSLHYYNNGAATTMSNVTPTDTLHPSLFVSSGSYDAQWEYLFIRPYGGATDPTVSFYGAETGGALQIAFDGTLAPIFATDIEFVDSNTVKAITPANTNGLHNTIVYNADGRFDTLTNSYTFAAPTLTEVTPDIGTTAGGSNITITGTNFTEGGFRRPISILNKSTSTLTNQTLYFTVDTAALISGGKMQSGCQDIRVKDSDHVTYLNHWVEGCNSTLTHIWVNIASLPPEGKTIYLHYGNTNFASATTPENFFPTLTSSNNKLWLKSDYGVTSAGNLVSAWADASGNGNNVSQLTETNKPSYNAVYNNGLPSISFDGVDNYLSRTGFTGLPTGTANRSAFVVNRYDNNGYGGVAYGNNATLATFGMVINGSGYLGVQGWGTDYMTTSNAVTYLGIHLHEAILNSLSLSQWKNGSLIYGPTVTALNTASTKIEIGREIDGTPYKDMDLFEVIIFDKALSTAERQEIENYINLKYDLNNNIQTNTFTGAEIGSATTLSAYIEGAPIENFASFNYVDSSTITAITAPHAPATVDITIATPDAQTATGFGSFTFADPPTITSIDPVTGVNNNTALSVNVIGTNISALTELKLSKAEQADILCTNYSNVTGTTLTCQFNIENASTGDWNVDIYTPSITPGANSSLTNGFTITQAPPVFTSFDPSGGSVLGGNTVTITGNYFVYRGGNYTTPFTINNTGGEETDYQVALTLNTSAPIAAGHMRSDCGDIRVYANHDYTIPIPYYLESGCNTTSTVLWVKIPTLAASATTTVYVNYGLPDRTSESNGNNVFLFFDDFEGATLDTSKWVVGGYANWMLETADRYQGTNSSKNGDLPDYMYPTSYMASKNGNNLINVPTGKYAIIDMHWKVSSEAAADYLYYCHSDDDSTLPACTMASGYSNRIAGTVAWSREQSTGMPLASGLHRIKFAYEKTYYTSVGSDTGWIDDVKVRLYSTNIGNSVAGTELVEQNSPLVVTFDSTNSATVTYINPTTITAVAPAHSAGPVNITVTNPDLQNVVGSTQYLYAEPPTITAINPNSGFTNESLFTVTITGTDFQATPTAKLTKLNETDINCTTPRTFIDGSPNDSFQCDLDLTTATSNGNWTLVVTNPDTQIDTLVDGFTITYPAPTLTDVDPGIGPAAGGTLVALTGTNFIESATHIVPYLISYSGTALTDYQVQLQLDTETLAGSSMRSDCADIRIFDNDKTTQLNYYIENNASCGTSTPLNIWVKVPSIPDCGKNIYLRFGDSSWTTSLSNSTNTFISVIPNVLAEWQMDELSGATVEDSSSGNNDGSAIGTTIVDGKFGKARKFQGTSDYVNFGVNAAINPSGLEAEHTMEAWIKLEASQSSYPTLFNLWEEDGNYDKSYLVDFPGGNVRYYVMNAAYSAERSTSSNGVYLFDNNWHHIVVTNDRSGGLNYLNIYIDGILRNTPPAANYGMRTVLPVINLQMAKQYFGGYLGLWGLIDEARVYNRALTASEITALYNNYGFLDSNSGNLLVKKTTGNPPVASPAGLANPEPPQVFFGLTESTSVSFFNSTSLEAVTPPGTGTVDVTVTNYDGQFATLTDGFTFTEPPEITSIVPNTGHNQESITGVAITGTNFIDTPTITLYIGETPLPCTNVTYVDATQLTCDLDLNGAFAGLYSVQVRNPDNQTDLLTNGFEVTYPQPTITNVTPSVGNVAGGQTVTIQGTYFVATPEVDFYDAVNGFISATSVSYVSPTEITVVTPANTMGLKSIIVTNPAPNSMTVTAPAAYEYIDPPLLTSIAPNSGANDTASLQVVITGSNFVAPLSAYISKTGEDPINCTGVRNFIDSTTDTFQCDLNLVDATTGSWNLTVTNGNGQISEPLVDAFEVTYAAPTIISILPNQVASGSTSQVQIGGTNFYSIEPYDVISVEIGGSLCTTPTVITPNSLSCFVPPLSTGTYSVLVITGAGTASAPDFITYFDAPTVSAIDPNHGLTTGGTNVTITGTNFFGTPAVYFNHLPSDDNLATNIIVVNSTTITATTPVSTAGAVDVEIVTDAGDATLTDGYTYENPPADPDASSLTTLGDRLEPIGAAYYDNLNLSPVNATLVNVRAVEQLTGYPMVGRNIELTVTPLTDIVIHSTSCYDQYNSALGNIGTTDAQGTACFLIWSTSTPDFEATEIGLSATIIGAGAEGNVVITQTAELSIEQMAHTSILNYRFRNDDGTELTATPIADTSTPYYNAENDLSFRLRFGLTRHLPLGNSFAFNDEFSPSGHAEIGARPLPAAQPLGVSSFRAFPSYAIDNSTNSLYIATPNRESSKARIYNYDLTDLTAAPTFFEFPGTVNFTPTGDDDIDQPFNDNGGDMVTKMFIDEDNQLLYLVVSPYYAHSKLTRVYKVNLTTNTVVDVYSDENYSHGSSLDSEIDLANGFLYLTIGANYSPEDAITPIKVQKLSLNGPAEAMTMVGELPLSTGSDMIQASVIDLNNQFLYLTNGTPHKITKIDLDVSPTLPPVKVDEIALVPVPATSPEEKVAIQGAVIDTINGFAYFSSSSNFNDPLFDGTQRSFITKVDIDPARTFEVISRLSTLPPDPAADTDSHGNYVYLPPTYDTFSTFPYASIDQINGYAYFPFTRRNLARNTLTHKLMRVHLDSFTKDSVYDEMNYGESNSLSIKGSIFRPETGRGYIIREMADGDLITEFNSTTSSNFKLQSSPNVDGEYCNYASAASYTWSDLPNADFVMEDSAHFVDGAPTTDITGLLYDNNDHFVPGQMKDQSATTAQINTGKNELTEIEYSLKPTAAAEGSYCFRLVDADTDHDNQVGGHANLLYNIVTEDFEAANYHHFIPLTVGGVILDKTEVNVVEGSTTDSYGIKLASAPSSPVTITVNADDDRLILTPDSTPLTPTQTILTFDDTNWDTFQYVNLSALDNGIVNGTTNENIRHTATSTDEAYNNIIITPVASHVTDYGSTISNVLATVSGTITFTPPNNFSFPDTNTGSTTPNYSPALTVHVEEGRGSAYDFTMTLQADEFCRAAGICIPLNHVYLATANLVNAFNTFTTAQVGQFLANYLQVGESTSDPATYVHADPADNRPLSSAITLIDSRNVPSGNSDNPLQGTLDYDLHLMIDFANIPGITSGTYTTLLTLDLNPNPL